MYNFNNGNNKSYGDYLSRDYSNPQYSMPSMNWSSFNNNQGYSKALNTTFDFNASASDWRKSQLPQNNISLLGNNNQTTTPDPKNTPKKFDAGKAGALITGIANEANTTFDYLNSIKNGRDVNLAKNGSIQTSFATGSNSLVSNDLKNRQVTQSIGLKEIDPHTSGEKAMGIVKSTANGASTGLAVGGPWGAVIGAAAGALVGGVRTIFGNRKAKRQAKIANNLAAMKDREQATGMQNAVTTQNTINQNNLANKFSNRMNPVNYAAYGGALDFDTNQQANNIAGLSALANNKMTSIPNSFSNKFDEGGTLEQPTMVDAGGTHEENPNMGVQMGTDPQGSPNLVEQGEVVLKGAHVNGKYVLSNRLPIPEDLAKKYKLNTDKTLTFAEAYKQLTKDFKNRENDIFYGRTRRAMDIDYMKAQEELKELQDYSNQVEQTIKNVPPEQLGQLAQSVKDGVPADQALAEEQMMQQQQQQQIPMDNGIQDISGINALGGNIFSPGGRIPLRSATNEAVDYNTKSNNLDFRKNGLYGYTEPTGIRTLTLWNDNSPTQQSDINGISSLSPIVQTKPQDNTSSDAQIQGLTPEQKAIEDYYNAAMANAAPMLDENLRYAPAVAKGLNVIKNLATPNDTRLSDYALSAAQKQAPLISNRNIDFNLGRHVFDNRQPIIDLNNNYATTLGAVVDNSNGNAATARMGALSANNNYNKAYGDYLTNKALAQFTADNALAEQRMKVDEANRQADVNVQMANQRAQMAQQERGDKLTISGLSDLMDQDAARREAVSKDIAGLASDIGGIGLDNVGINAQNRLMATGYYGPMLQRLSGESEAAFRNRVRQAAINAVGANRNYQQDRQAQIDFFTKKWGHDVMDPTKDKSK